MKPSSKLATLVGGSFLLMGLSMPSCPGQQALQQAVESLKVSQAEFKGKMTAHEGALKALQEEVAGLQSKLTEVTATVLAQKAALEKMDEALKSKSGAKGRPAASKKK
jgi:chromosome segregation ATPase